MSEVGPEPLEVLAGELEAAAEQLRSGELDPGAGRRARRALRRARRAPGQRRRATRARGAVRHAARAGEPALSVAVAYPSHLQQEIEDYLAELHVREGAGHERPRRGDALLAARGRQADPAGARARHGRGARPRPRARSLPFAAAIELIHTYSLIHDDLPAMDDDELRRGQPTCHVKFGEAVAILAGDGLFAEAIRLVTERQTGRAGERAGRASAAWSRPPASTAWSAASTWTSRASPDDLRRLHELKTGRLIAASIDCVPILCGVSGPATIALGRFAAELGVLFQIVDDILDVTGEEAALGKPQGSDERHGKLTYVSVHGLDRARELAAESHRNARAALPRAASRPRRWTG